MVFSSALNKVRLTCSTEYCLRKNKHHSRCFGFDPAGTSYNNFLQTREQTNGVTPKNDLKRLKKIFLLDLKLFFIYIFPNCKNVSILILKATLKILM